MTAKNPPKPEEPFLNVFARKLGRAAGALTNVAQGLSENLTALPQTVSTQLGAAKAEPRVRHRTTGKLLRRRIVLRQRDVFRALVRERLLRKNHSA